MDEAYHSIHLKQAWPPQLSILLQAHGFSAFSWSNAQPPAQSALMSQSPGGALPFGAPSGLPHLQLPQGLSQDPAESMQAKQARLEQDRQQQEQAERHRLEQKRLQQEQHLQQQQQQLQQQQEAEQRRSCASSLMQGLHYSCVNSVAFT